MGDRYVLGFAPALRFLRSGILCRPNKCPSDETINQSPGEIKRREVVLDPQESLEEINSMEVELGSELLLLQLFLNSNATDIDLVTAPHSN